MTGLFFGSFDPPHIGHVHIVTSALNSKLVDKVIVIPAFKNVWKETETSFDNRFLMCVEAFYDIDNVFVSPIEEYLLNRMPVPTHVTLEHFKEHIGDFKIITTTETYLEIPKWQKGEEILKKYKFIVVDSHHFVDTDIDWSEENDVIYLNDINISSTEIRRKLKEGSILQPFLQTEVLEYIKRYKLYE